MNYLINFTTILFVIIALLLSPCYLIEYEEIYTYKMNNSTPDELIIDKFPDGTVLIADVINNHLKISLLLPNRTMKFINNIRPCSTTDLDSCIIEKDEIIPLKQNNILIAYQEDKQYYAVIFDWLGNIISREMLINSKEQLDLERYYFIKNTFYEDKYLFIFFKNKYFSYIEYKVM